MKVLTLEADEAAIFRDRTNPRSEAVWIDVRRRALALALEADEMTEVVGPDGERLDLVYPSSINP